MNASRFAAPIYSSLLTIVLAGPSTLLAQEIVEVTGRDRRIDAGFEEVYRVGVLEGESWEMFGQVGRVAFDAEGNLYVFDGASGPSNFGGVRLTRSGNVRVLVFDAADPPTSRPVLRIGLDGETARADTAAEGWLPPRTDLEALATGSTAQLRGMLRGVGVPTVFEPRLMVGVLADGGVVHSDSSAYALKVTPPGARDVARVIRRPFEAEPVTEKVREAHKERMAAARRALGETGGSTMLMVVGAAEGNNPQPEATFELEERYHHEVPVLLGLATTWRGASGCSAEARSRRPSAPSMS